MSKEYLKKYDDGSYVLMDGAGYSGQDNWIEIPDGAEKYIQGIKYPTRFGFVRGDEFYSNSSKKWLFHGDDPHDYKVVWQREKPQEKCADKLSMEEALEFAEELRNMGESGWSKEKHSHYKKDVSHLNVIDPYRIADLYDLHPCAEHIMKKSLCAGGRGHKDLLRDIQDIIDTAERWKEMIEEDER